MITKIIYSTASNNAKNSYRVEITNPETNLSAIIESEKRITRTEINNTIKSLKTTLDTTYLEI